MGVCSQHPYDAFQAWTQEQRWVLGAEGMLGIHACFNDCMKGSVMHALIRVCLAVETRNDAPMTLMVHM